METPLNPPDASDAFDSLEAALRLHRGTVPDAGFSARVATRIRNERRRQKLARLLPVVMGLLGLFLAGALSPFSIPRLPALRPDLLPDFALLGEDFIRTLAPIGQLLARFGLPPWLVAAGALAALLSVLLNQRQDSLGTRL